MINLTNKTIIHHPEQNYIQFRKLLEFPELIHCFTLKPLDFMSSHAEASANAQLRLAAALGIPQDSFCKPQQTHSDHIRIVGRSDAGILPPKLTDTDGCISNESGLALLLTFADCTPLLFYDPVKRVIADIHSGWRGTLARIGTKAVEKMKEQFGCDPSDLICCIGPHLRKCHFEVDRDVFELFEAEFADFGPADGFSSYRADRNKYYIDTAAINMEMLRRAGLREENLCDCGICTVCHSKICQSYRADKNDSGRSAAVIMLRTDR